MRIIKKIILGLIIVFGFILIFSNIVKANNEKVFEQTEEIILKPLEDRKISNLRLLLKPSIKVLSVPTGEDVSKYYYNQLTSDLAREIYNNMANSYSNQIVLDISKYQLYCESDNRVDFFKTNVSPYINDGYAAYTMDSAENYCWAKKTINIRYSFAELPNNRILLTRLIINADLDEWSNRENFNNKLTQVCDSITGNNTYEIVKAINDYIDQNVEYEFLEDTDIEQTAYGALMLNKAVCEGQAQLFNLMCRKKGILSINVYGYADESGTPTTAHAWNYIYDTSREQWYAVDVTWNNDCNEPLYLMIGSDTTVYGKKFSENHISGFKLVENQTYEPVSPIISNTKYNPNAPGIVKTYSTKDLTNDDVIVTLKADKNVQSITGWQLSSDNKTLTKNYTANIEENVTVKAQTGDETTIEILINNIDKTAPSLTESYSTTELTNKDVIVTIMANEEIQEVAGWNLSTDKKQLTKMYTANAEDMVKVKDLAGNEVSKKIVVNNIDKTAPSLVESYSMTELTNENVIVTITANEEIQEVAGWNLSTDKKQLTKMYIANVEETVRVKDLVGNEASKIIMINNIDKTAPSLVESYSITELTNKDVIVTIIADEEIQEIEGWDLSNNSKQLTKTYTENAEETVRVKDFAGNETSKKIIINNIDKVVPTIVITTDLSSEKDCCTVTIKASEEIELLDGWSYKNDNTEMVKTYRENLTEMIVVTDLAGNKSIEETISITGIEKIFNSEVYVIENTKIKNIQPNTNYEDFVKNINSNRQYVIKEGSNIVTETGKIKTGQILTIGNNNYTLIVTGDVTGDGQANIQDILSVNKHRLNKTQLLNEYFEAGDTNKNGKIDINDILQINKYRLGKVSNL